jgi:hypothetical protein
MAESKERRSPRERETLMHSTPEQAQEWREGVSEKLQAQAGKVVRADREVVAEAVAQEFANEGYGVTTLKHPWEHSEAEHAEAQRLVNVAFAKDLATALRQAKQSPTWPRNLDLFHDVLTTEMYDLLREHKLNKQPVVGWVLLGVGIVLAAILIGAVILTTAS